MPVGQQSVLPTVRGVPWWGAVLIAAGFTAVGATIDLLVNSSLGLVYNIFFLVGVVLAALAVRRRALFTAAVQPPLVTLGVGIAALLIASKVSAGAGKSQSTGRMLLNVALPFSNLFPWILGGFLLSLAIVLYRWFSTRAAADAAGRRSTGTASSPLRVPAGQRPAPAAAETKKSSKKAAKGAAAASAAAAEPQERRPAPRPAPAARDAAESARPARRRADEGRPAPAPRPAAQKPAAQKPAAAQQPAAPRQAPQRRARQQQAPQRPAPQRPAAQRPTQHDTFSHEPASKPSLGDLPPMEISAEPTIQRAAPQVIPPRPTAGRQRRTAGQQLRAQIEIEDLTAGLDD